MLCMLPWLLGQVGRGPAMCLPIPGSLHVRGRGCACCAGAAATSPSAASWLLQSSGGQSLRRSCTSVRGSGRSSSIHLPRRPSTSHSCSQVGVCVRLRWRGQPEKSETPQHSDGRGCWACEIAGPASRGCWACEIAGPASRSPRLIFRGACCVGPTPCLSRLFPELFELRGPPGALPRSRAAWALLYMLRESDDGESGQRGGCWCATGVMTSTSESKAMPQSRSAAAWRHGRKNGLGRGGKGKGRSAIYLCLNVCIDAPCYACCSL
jgi:hypothetical protein